MGKILEEIRNEILTNFQIGKSENMFVIKEITKGFSNAEVYLVELKGDSHYKGNYFLKIDTSDEDFKHKGIYGCFSKAVNILKSEKIGSYYVFLMEIAGASSIEYKSFYDIEGVEKRRNATEKIILNILKDVTKKKEYIKAQVFATEIFNRYLISKLKDDGTIKTYVNRVSDGNATIATSFSFQSDVLFPNALAYALNNDLWESKKVPDTNCCMHGDLHGDNVFYSERTNDYALIDFSLYREDGYVFFDTAYFELSLLLHNFVNIEFSEWMKVICCCSERTWNELEGKDSNVLKTIDDCELKWIDEECSSEFNYKDNLLEARYIARIIAGLNYAGKRTVDDETRKKAFFYACAYLKGLLQIKKISTYSKKTVAWNDIECKSDVKNNEISNFLCDVSNFDESQNYLLVLGNEYDYKDSVCKALCRINWSGIISFKRTEVIEPHIKESEILNVLMDAGNLDLLTNANCWIVYADGVVYNPDTLTDSFPKWRNKYSTFINDFCKRIDSALAPNDLQLIIDLDTFSPEYVERMKRFCESLDSLENLHINIALISTTNKVIFNENDFAQLDFKTYITDIDSIACFCLDYLKGYNDCEITIPALNNMRVAIPENDYKFINSYLTLLHNRVIQHEGIVTAQKKLSFFYGERILWQSIEDELYVFRTEMEDYKKEIDSKLSKDEAVFLIKVFYAPGSGASVLARVLAWKYRNDYPVVLAEKMDKNISESVQKIYAVSGKTVLLFIDGDFSENDISQLMKHAHSFGVKLGIVFFCRTYTDAKMTILTTDDGFKFLHSYSTRMRELKDYSESTINKRIDNMKKLATTNSLNKYRMPFFFGVNAFEKDFISIKDYLDKISNYVDASVEYKKIINYIALLTYYTEGEGLNLNYVKKILSLSSNFSSQILLMNINGELDNIIYYYRNNLKICHSVVALEILKHTYKFASSEFEEFLENFVRDLCSCEKRGEISETLNDLFMSLFIKRDIEGEVIDGVQRKNFSPIILNLENSYLQEKFFSFLVDTMPNNAHFRQHYGRLIIFNNPGNLEKAKEQFDEAINLEPNNPLHYHARGNMYTKYVINLCKTKKDNYSSYELYNDVKLLVEEAICDYEKSTQLIISTKDSVVDLSYPYASIIQTITYIVHHLFVRFGINNIEEKEFLMQKNRVSEWCWQLIQQAKNYDANTEVRYDSVRDDEFYSRTRLYLTRYEYTHEEMKTQLKKHPNDLKILQEYLYTFDVTKEKWKNKTQNELKTIIDCCSKLMTNVSSISEGILWRWFNSCINFSNSKVGDMLGFLETQEGVDSTLTIQFMLYVIKLGFFLKNNDTKLVEEIKGHIEKCRNLRGNNNRTETRYFYNGKGVCGLCYSKEEGVFIKGKVVKWGSRQNGYISLDLASKLRAFFVPSVIGLMEEGAVGTDVKFKLGFSFDGLRAWNVEIINKEK